MTCEADSEVRTAGDTARMLLFASVVVSFLSASSAPTPLYQHYNVAWHGSALNTTVAFGSYAIAVLAGLLVLGELAAHLGRRAVVLYAIAAQIVALVLFATAGSFDELLAGRIVQGLAAGAALGTLGAAMIEADQPRGTLANAAAPGVGTGFGALLAGVVVGFLPWPTHLIYVLLVLVLAVQGAAIARLPQTSRRETGAMASLRPHLAVPVSARAALLTVAPVLFSVWALAGLYGSLGPALSRQLADSHSVALGGVGLFLLAGAAAVATVTLRTATNRTLMLTGIGSLVLGVTGTIVSIDAGSVTGYFTATAIAGVGFGSGFQGGIRTVLSLVRPDERAGLLSAVYLISYLGMGVPAVAAGLIVSRGEKLTQVAIGYGLVIIGLAVVALVRLVIQSRPVSATIAV